MSDTRYMTATRKTSVTHADGTVSKRASKTRTYSHAVEVTPAPAASYAAYLTQLAAEATAKAASLRAAAEAASVAITSRGWSTGDPYYSHQATLRGTNRQVYTWCSADGQRVDVLADGKPVVSAKDSLVADALSGAQRAEQDAERFTARAAAVLAAGEPVGEYKVVRWSSRADLAVKALSEFERYTDWGHTVRVVPVD